MQLELPCFRNKDVFSKEKSMRTLLFIGVLLMASCSESQVKEVVEQAGHQVVNAEQFNEMLAEEGIQLVDVRTVEEYNQGTIGNAENIDFLATNFAVEIAKLDKSKKTLIFCRSGGRSGKAGAIMEEMGFGTVVDLARGYSGWPFK